MLADLIGWLIGDAIGGDLGERMADRREQRLSRSGRTPCALRVESGSQRGLGRRWRHGTARLSPGTIRLRGVTVRVASVDRTGAWRPSGLRAWSVSSRTEVVRVHTSDGAVLEWALLRPWLDWAVEQVQPASGTTTTP